MKLVELLNHAARGYPDQALRDHYVPDTGAFVDGGGDTLADFIVKEIQDTFDEQATDDEQIGEAIRVLEVASMELDVVTKALGSARD